MVRRRQVSPVNSLTKLRKPTCKPIYCRKKINKLFAGLGSVRIAKNCDHGLENAALGLWPRAAFSSPRPQFFTIRTSQLPKQYIYFEQTVLRYLPYMFKQHFRVTKKTFQILSANKPLRAVNCENTHLALRSHFFFFSENILVEWIVHFVLFASASKKWGQRWLYVNERCCHLKRSPHCPNS